MREILFMGKKFDNGEWVMGDLSQHKSGKKFIKNGSATHSYEVIPETVGQYTGLTDRNGKKIFEGDIIKADNWLHKNMKVYTVVFEDCGFYAKHRHGDSWNFDHLENIEVIGNIHDNPELLKGGE